jgi:hypothetical protein
MSAFGGRAEVDLLAARRRLIDPKRTANVTARGSHASWLPLLLVAVIPRQALNAALLRDHAHLWSLAYCAVGFTFLIQERRFCRKT